MKIRRATVEDVDAICDIYDNDGESHPRSLRTYPLPSMIMDDSNTFLIALDQAHAPIGFIHLRTLDQKAKIDFLSVKTSIGPQKVEEKLLDAVEKEAVVPMITIYAPKSNSRLLRLLAKKNYRLFNEVPNLFGDGETGAYLIKKLSGEPAKPKQKKTKRRRQSKNNAKAEEPLLLGTNILKENLKKLEELS